MRNCFLRSRLNVRGESFFPSFQGKLATFKLENSRLFCFITPNTGPDRPACLNIDLRKISVQTRFNRWRTPPGCGCRPPADTFPSLSWPENQLCHDNSAFPLPAFGRSPTTPFRFEPFPCFRAQVLALLRSASKFYQKVPSPNPVSSHYSNRISSFVPFSSFPSHQRFLSPSQVLAVLRSTQNFIPQELTAIPAPPPPLSTIHSFVPW